MERIRTIAFRNFYRSGRHIYEDQLGFGPEVRNDFRSHVSHDIFVEALGTRYYEMSLFYVDNQKFYFFATMEKPIQVLELPKNKDLSRFVGFQCDATAYEYGTVLATFNTAEEIWNDLKIDGKSLEEVIPRSYILWFC